MREPQRPWSHTAALAMSHNESHRTTRPTAQGDWWAAELTALRQEIAEHRAALAAQALEPLPPPPSPTHRRRLRQWCQVQQE